MRRFYQVFSAFVLLVSLALVWYTLSAQFTHPPERAGLGNDDGKQFVSNAQHSRTSHNYSHPTTLPRHTNYGRDTPLTPHTLKMAAIGDLHSDLDRTLSILKKAKVVDDDGHWSGKYDLLVQVGDVVDKGPDPIGLFHYIEQLRTEARAARGNVLSLMGDHEAFAVMGNPRISSSADRAHFRALGGRATEFRTGAIGKYVADHYEIALRIPFQAPLDNPNTPYDPNVESRFSHSAISFVHGGLHPDYPYLTPFPTKMNEIGRVVKEIVINRERYSDDVINLYMDKEESPLLYRGWAKLPEEEICPRVDEVLQKTGTRRMVMGHTYRKEIIRRCDGKVFIIDTGISSSFDDVPGIPSLLSIDYELYPIPGSPEDPQQLWKEVEVLTAIYVGREDVQLWKEEDTFSANSA